MFDFGEALLEYSATIVDEHTLTTDDYAIRIGVLSTLHGIFLTNCSVILEFFLQRVCEPPKSLQRGFLYPFA